MLQKASLNFTPREWQFSCLKNMARFTVLVVHRQAGKTELALMHLLDSAIRFPKGNFAYFAPFQKQVEVIAWARLKSLLEPMIDIQMVIISETTKSVIFNNGSAIRLFGADNGDSLRGARFHGVVLDEVAQIKSDFWYSALQPTLSSTLGTALFIGTPNGLNLLSDLYEKGKRGDTDWYSMKYTIEDTNVITESEVIRLQMDMPPLEYSREYLCDFGAKAEDQLISFEETTAAANRIYRPEEYSLQPRILGIDPARHGDRSVIFKRQGLRAYEPLVYNNVTNMDLADNIASVIRDWNPDAVFIDSGGGAGVIDRLRQLGHNVIEVCFGGNPRNKVQFLNRRIEMWWEMRDWLRQGGSIPNDPLLKSELTTPKYLYNTKDQKLLEPKDKLSLRLGRSPDLADALALTFASPVSCRDIPYVRERTRIDMTNFDPHRQTEIVSGGYYG